MKLLRGTGGVSQPRVRLEKAERKAPDRWVLDGQQAHHLLHVRRCVEGDRIEGLWEGKLLSLRLELNDGLLCGVVEEEISMMPEKNLWLLLGLLKPDAFERSLRMATESGAEKIIPIICERSVPRVDRKKWSGKRSRWMKIIEESTKQSRVPEKPVLYEPMPLESVLSLSLPEARYAAMLDGGPKTLIDLKPSQGAVFAVGPEGDWTPGEREALLERGFIAVSLGSRILTSPTAVAVGLGFLSMRLEQSYESKN